MILTNDQERVGTKENDSLETTEGKRNGRTHLRKIVTFARTTIVGATNVKRDYEAVVKHSEKLASSLHGTEIIHV